MTTLNHLCAIIWQVTGTENGYAFRFVHNYFALFLIHVALLGNIGHVLFSMHFIRWGLILSWSKRTVVGSVPQRRHTAKAMAKRPQSLQPSFCHCTSQYLTIISLLEDFIISATNFFHSLLSFKCIESYAFIVDGEHPRVDTVIQWFLLRCKIWMNSFSHGSMLKVTARRGFWRPPTLGYVFS